MKAVAVAALLLTVICGCAQHQVETSPSPPGPGTTSPTRTTGGQPSPSTTTPPPTSVGQPPTGDRYAALAGALHKRGVAIWWETDLVARWLEGPAAFDLAITRLGMLAREPGVVGFKISDEIGYGDGLGSQADATRFLTQARTALARVAPGKQLLVDALVPELGCLPWRGTDQVDCAQRARLKYPAATAAAVEDYLRAKLIDRLDLSTGLLDDSTYSKWGTTKHHAQSEAWNHVKEQGWLQLTILQARKALAERNGYQGNADQAAADVGTYIDVPIAAGAQAVDIWTWRQQYQGNTVSLLGPGLSPNPLWTALVQQHQRGAQLLTHMRPSAMPTDQRSFDEECNLAASAFTAVFVAAGTG